MEKLDALDVERLGRSPKFHSVRPKWSLKSFVKRWLRFNGQGRFWSNAPWIWAFHISLLCRYSCDYLTRTEVGISLLLMYNEGQNSFLNMNVYWIYFSPFSLVLLHQTKLWVLEVAWMGFEVKDKSAVSSA